MTNRFDYVKYDEEAINTQEGFKELFIQLDDCIQKNLKPGRASALVFTKLEEAYMWVGKAIRDEQIIRNKV